MVLINNLTIDEINAALLHLQRSQGEIVGGNKGNTINNISVTQQGGGGYSPDFSSAIKNLEKRVDTLDVKTEQNQQNIAGQSKINVTQKDQISDLYNLVNNLRSSQITELFFDEDTRVLTLATTDTRYDVPLPSEEVSLTFDSTSNKLVFSMGEQTKEVTLPYINASEKGVANGVATLDATGRVPYSQLPESAMEFKGEWNADTNTPTLKDGHGTNGDFYICNVGGTANFGTSQNPRTITFYVNDRVIYQGNVAQWKRLPASEVRTVNGQSGDVTLNGTNVNYSAASNSPTLKDKIDTVEGYAKTQSDWGQTNTSAIDFIKNKPSLATVATSGSYNDLSNKPTIPAAQIQSDWTQTDSTKKDFIKNKIPIWITSGSADDNMSPIDSVTNGSMRPPTSNAVAKGTIQYLDWATYSGATLGEAVLNAMNSLPIIYNTKNNVYSFRGTWSGQGYFQALVSNPRTVSYVYNVLVQYAKAVTETRNDNGVYVLEVLYDANSTPKFSLLRTQKMIAENDTEPYLKVVASGSASVTLNANTGKMVQIPVEIPDGYKALGYVGLITSGPSGAINWYSYEAKNIYGKTGSFNQGIYFRNYTDITQTAAVSVSILCCKA